MFSHSWSKGSYCKLVKQCWPQRGCCCCIRFISSCTKDFLLLLTGFSKSFVKHCSASQLAMGRWCVETLCCDQLAPLEKQKRRPKLISTSAVLSQKLVSAQYVVNLTVLLIYCTLLWKYSTESRSQKWTKTRSPGAEAGSVLQIAEDDDVLRLFFQQSEGHYKLTSCLAGWARDHFLLVRMQPRSKSGCGIWAMIPLIWSDHTSTFYSISSGCSENVVI